MFYYGWSVNLWISMTKSKKHVIFPAFPSLQFPDHNQNNFLTQQKHKHNNTNHQQNKNKTKTKQQQNNNNMIHQ